MKTDDLEVIDIINEMIDKEEYQKAYETAQKLHKTNKYAKVSYAIMLYSDDIKGVDKDVNKAIKLLKEAAESDSVEALRFLGLCYLEKLNNIEKGIYYLKEAIKKGNVTAMIDLGSFYEFGEYGIEKDLDKALEYYAMAVKYGSKEGLRYFVDLLIELKDGEMFNYIKEHIGIIRFFLMILPSSIKGMFKSLMKKLRIIKA